MYRSVKSVLVSTEDQTQWENQMRKVRLFGIVITMMLAGIAAWANSGHSAVKAIVAFPQIDPFSLMVGAKDLPSQESLTLKMWPDNGIVRY